MDRKASLYVGEFSARGGFVPVSRKLKGRLVFHCGRALCSTPSLHHSQAVAPRCVCLELRILYRDCAPRWAGEVAGPGIAFVSLRLVVEQQGLPALGVWLCAPAKQSWARFPPSGPVSSGKTS